MTPLQWVLLIIVGAVASAINSVAGGGSLISFPALSLGLGLPSKVANATNALGLWPGSLAGAVGFINLLPTCGHHIRTLAIPTLLGALCGSALLVITRAQVFDAIVPILLLVATAILAFQPQIKKWALRDHDRISISLGLTLQFLVSMYGGYFGAGMGIMMLACFALFMDGNIHEINAVKSWLGLIINLFASALFVVKGMVALQPAIAVAIGSLIGGFYAAKLSQKVNPEKLRVAIVVYGFGATAYFFAKTWWR